MRRAINLEDMFYDSFQMPEGTSQEEEKKERSGSAKVEERPMTNKRYAQEFVRKLQTFHLLEDLSSNAGAEPRREADRANEAPQLFCLLESFARNMVSILSTNLKLDLKKPKEKNV